LKTAYFSKKAQSLSELAIFGGVLLLVLSYFVSLGIKLTYQQDVQMRAFRMALFASARESIRPDAESSVAIIEDKYAPDPRNMVGKGDLVTVAGQGNVVWGNQMQRPMSMDPVDSPRLKYVINGVERDYSVAEVRTITSGMYSTIWVLLSDQVTRKEIQWSELRCYKPTPDSPKQARILLNPLETDPAKIETEIITAVSETSGINPPLGKSGDLWAIVELPENLANGDPVNVLNVLMSEYGDIDPKYMNLDAVKERAIEYTTTPFFNSEYNLQGFLFGQSRVSKNSKESLLLDETGPGPSGYKSTTQFDVETTITHYVRKNSGKKPELGFPDTFSYSPPLKPVKGWIWESAK